MAVSDKAIKQAILFFGAVSFFLGKKALTTNGPAETPPEDPLLRRLREAGAL